MVKVASGGRSPMELKEEVRVFEEKKGPSENVFFFNVKKLQEKV